MKNIPKVSITIPLYNCESHIRETIDSVLAQTFSDFELIIIDDQSTDHSYHIAKSYDDPRIRVIKNIKRQGFFGNWNACLEFMTGTYCKLLPHDDTLETTCLEKQVQILDEFPEVVLVHNARKIIDPNGRVLTLRRLKESSGIKDSNSSLREIVRSGTNPIGEPASVMFRRKTKEQIGPFSNEDMYSIDIDYWSRLLAKGKKYYIDEILSSFRVWPDSASVKLFGSQSKSMRAFFQRLEKLNPETIQPADVCIGTIKSIILEIARGGFYGWMKLKNK
ncbi:glycosyltransferase [Pontiellaceae bacterium B12219]|nr:glycosyltransferase [Pontiellaceae bacterium B12219]